MARDQVVQKDLSTWCSRLINHKFSLNVKSREGQFFNLKDRAKKGLSTRDQLTREKILRKDINIEKLDEPFTQ
jgi:hypothetical protein